MKRLILSTICFITFGGIGVFSQNLSSEGMEQIEIFEESVVRMMDGINNRNKAALNDAIEGFNELRIADITIDDYRIINRDGLCSPEIFFGKGYCEAVLSDNFDLIKMAELEMERSLSDDGSIIIFDGAVKPGASVSYIIEVGGDMFVSVASYPAGAVKCEVQADDTDVPMSKDESGYIIHGGLVLEDEIPVKITLSNPVDEVVSFSIAVK